MIDRLELWAISGCAIGLLGSTFAIGALSQRTYFENKYLYIIAQIINFIGQIFAILNTISIYYFPEEYPFDFFFYTSQFISLAAVFNIWTIMAIDLYVLSRFSVLDTRLTPRRQRILMYFIYGLVLIQLVFVMITWIGNRMLIGQEIPPILLTMAMIGQIQGKISLLLFGIYDNIQLIYISLLLHQFNENKHSYGAKSAFRKAVIFNSCAVIFDWFGIIISIVAVMVKFDLKEQTALQNLSMGLLGFHTSLMPFIFFNYRDLAFAS